MTDVVGQYNFLLILDYSLKYTTDTWNLSNERETTLIVFLCHQPYEHKNTSRKHVKQTALTCFGILMTH